MWQQLAGAKRLYYIGISEALTKAAPRQLKPQILPAVHNAINVRQFPFQPKKKNHFITLARFTRDKGQHTAARLCHKLGYRLEMMGVVAGITSPRKLLLALANPLSEYRQYNDFKYYHDFVWPITLKDPKIRYVGNLGGEKKLKFLSEAKALLFPIDWEEPFGVAPIEALACGTPVVAMNRGALSEYIEHGVNGFLANNIAEFEEYMQRVDEIDPAACRKSVEKKFSIEKMGQSYLDRYQQVLEKDKGLIK
jgi:glycosyltransferase involved in cell wall biosynthesis